MYAYYVTNCIGISTPECNANDIAIEEVLPPGSQDPGYLAFTHFTDNDLNNYSQAIGGYSINRGYPGSSDFCGDGVEAGTTWCGGGCASDTCQLGTLYGDQYWCQYGNFFSPDGNGDNRNVSHNCAASRGHSGSGMLVFDNASNGLWVAGVHIGGGGDYLCNQNDCFANPANCYASNTSFGWPNIMRRITPEWYDWMLSFMSW